jgi:hypothetical protein
MRHEKNMETVSILRGEGTPHEEREGRGRGTYLWTG